MGGLASESPRCSRSVVPSYSVRNGSAFLQQRDDGVGELVAAAQAVGHENEVFTRVGLHELVDGVIPARVAPGRNFADSGSPPRGCR
jgi:hypothetical protein